jgi:hypothetical protein
MKNKITYLIVTLGFLGLMIGGLWYQQGLAQKTSLREILKLDPPLATGSPDMAQHVVSEPSEGPSSTPSGQFPNTIYVDSEQKITNDEIIALAKKITVKANPYLSPGWLHITSQIESFFTLSATLPDGSPVPTKSTNDLWALLGPDGYAIQAVTIDDTGDPKTTQTSVFQNGIWSNLSIGMTTQEKETYRPTLDNFISFAEAYKDILDLETTNLEVDGSQVVVFTATQLFQEPVRLAKSSNEIVGTTGKYYFSQVTGLPLRVEGYHIYPDGAMKLASRISLVNIENIETPPPEILAYFQ